MENTTINLVQLTQPLKTNGSIARDVIELFNTVCGTDWSFRIIEHQVHDSEVIVLGELSAGSGVRQQFGKAVISFDTDPTASQGLYEHLVKAADDALVQCAYMFGIKHEPEQQPQIPTSQSTTNTSSNNNGNGDRKLTNRQLAAIIIEYFCFYPGYGNSYGTRFLLHADSADRANRRSFSEAISLN